MSENIDSTGSDVDEDELLATMRALGHPTNVKIIRFLADQMSANLGDMISGLDFSPSTLGAGLRKLESLRVVRGDRPADQRKGRTINYSLDPSRIQMVTEEYLKYTLGSNQAA